MITHKSKQEKVKVTNFKTLPKIQILKFCKKTYTRHTFWSCLIRCMNMKWIQPILWAPQSGPVMRDGQTDGRTDKRTDGVKPIYPPTTLLCGGYNKEIYIVTGKNIVVVFWIYVCICPDFKMKLNQDTGSSAITVRVVHHYTTRTITIGSHKYIEVARLEFSDFT